MAHKTFCTKTLSRYIIVILDDHWALSFSQVRPVRKKHLKPEHSQENLNLSTTFLLNLSAHICHIRSTVTTSVTDCCVFVFTWAASSLMSFLLFFQYFPYPYLRGSDAGVFPRLAAESQDSQPQDTPGLSLRKRANNNSVQFLLKMFLLQWSLAEFEKKKPWAKLNSQDPDFSVPSRLYFTPVKYERAWLETKNALLAFYG